MEGRTGVDQRDGEAALALLERAKAGDADAFGQLAEEHRDGLLRLCHKMTGSREEAEDLVQETLLKCVLEVRQLRTALVLRHLALPHRRQHLPGPSAGPQALGPGAALGVVPRER